MIRLRSFAKYLPDPMHGITLVEATVGEDRFSLDHYGGRLFVYTNGFQEKNYTVNELVAALQDFSDRVAEAQKEAELYDGNEPCVIQAMGGNLWDATRGRLDPGLRGGWQPKVEEATVYPTVAAALAERPFTQNFGCKPKVVRIEDLPAVPRQMYEVVLQKMEAGELVENVCCDGSTKRFKGPLDDVMALRDELAGIFNPQVQYLIRPVADDVN